MCQITHMGRRTAWDDGNWLLVIAPSAVREHAHRAIPKVMEAEDIARVVADFGAAARRCKQGGFDGIEILSHSHLLGQFLSPLTNQREDEYGGSIENRCRLLLSVLAEVRRIVGDRFVICVRVTGDELTSGGLSSDDCVAVARMIEETGHVDMLNVLAGAPYDDLGLAEWVRPMGLPSAPHISIAGRIRAAVNLPILHAGGIGDLATADFALSEGHVDLVGMTRAQMADPHLVAKLKRGDADRIRPCVGLGYCVDRVNQGKAAMCGQNAAVGREAALPHILALAEEKRKVVVVGGGPAGLEVARVSAERGHDVVLFEASDRLGGQLHLASKGRVRRQVWGVADWLITEVEKLGVDVRLNVFADASDVLGETPDAVIVATGGYPKDSEELTVSSWDVLSGAARVSGDALVFDEIGDHAGAVVSEAMAGAGAKVELLTPDRSLLHDLGPTTSSVMLRDLSKAGVKFSTLSKLGGVERECNKLRVTVRNVLTQDFELRLVDHVMIERGAEPMDDVYFDLKDQSANKGQLDHAALIAGELPFDPPADGTFVLARVGDAVTGRNIHAAILDALRVCHKL